jgi:hypothetical protein
MSRTAGPSAPSLARAIDRLFADMSLFSADLRF